jgi:hypothetical protein
MVTYFMNGVQGNAVRPDGAPADKYTPYESQTGGQVIIKQNIMINGISGCFV